MRTIIGGVGEILVDLELNVTLKDLDLVWVSSACHIFKSST